jgi:glycine hydroxymethyltransferase
MAEGLFRAAVRGLGDEYRVLSAGVGAVDGQPPSAHAVTALRELNIDISRQRSRMLTSELVNQADYIFGMTHGHVDAVMLLYPQAAEKTFLLREFDETLDIFEKDISDPIGGSYDVYTACRDQIEQGIVSLLNFIEQTTTQSAAGNPAARHSMLTLGCDHAGFELKQKLKAYFEKKGATVRDVGTGSIDSTDYPDYAQKVAEAVANGESEYGILVCASGTGMCITANKIPGVRAANALNEEMARLAREHNDANILCIGSKFVTDNDAIQIHEHEVRRRPPRTPRP